VPDTFTVKWAMRTHPDGTVTGEVYVPQRAIPGISPSGYIKASSRRERIPARRGQAPAPAAVAQTKAGALAQAAGVAQGLLDNDLIRAALPPGSGVAIDAIKMLASSAAAGDLASAAKKVVGKGAKRLFDKLKFW
jgi:hypothetical protein